MAQRILAEGLPRGAYMCISEAPEKDTICFISDEIYSLLDKVATTSKVKPSP